MIGRCSPVAVCFTHERVRTMAGRVGRSWSNDKDLMARGRRNKRFEKRSKDLAKDCGLDWVTLNKFRKDNEEDIGTLMVSGFDETPAVAMRSSRRFLQEKAAAAGIDWTAFLEFLKGLMPIIASLMAMCGA